MLEPKNNWLGLCGIVLFARITVTFDLHTLVVLYQGICMFGQVHCLDISLLVVMVASRIMLLVFIIN